jgi:hypothetical protein
MSNVTKQRVIPSRADRDRDPGGAPTSHRRTRPLSRRTRRPCVPRGATSVTHTSTARSLAVSAVRDDTRNTRSLTLPASLTS